jgi:hypothetical protein
MISSNNIHSISEAYAKIITPVATRWNSNAMMVDSILRLQRPLEAIRDGENNTDLKALVPSAEDFAILKEISPMLNDIRSKSEELSQDNRPTSQLGLQILYNLNFHIANFGIRHRSPLVDAWMQSLRLHLIRRLPRAGTQRPILNLGNLLHPFFKGRLIKKESAAMFEQTKEELLESHPSTIAFRAQEAKQLPKESLVTLDQSERDVMEMSEEDIDLPSEKSEIQRELESFLALPNPPEMSKVNNK